MREEHKEQLSALEMRCSYVILGSILVTMSSPTQLFRSSTAMDIFQC
ncbi:hypothetical protein L798_13413 [Zootermopsis nevadensis]|uniref:Uncharacterized protein n=1 Tax=Zootermopsis nevadensis TaxID=136037 RepID=A0A067RIM9_ZOONE|nr:hypothetical protein L798_13413 [Zootermopsis nevadensis]